MKVLWVLVLVMNSETACGGLLGGLTSAFSGVVTDLTSKITSAVPVTIPKPADTVIGTTLSTIQEVVGTPVNLEELKFFLYTINNYAEPIVVNPLNPMALTGGYGRIFFIIHGRGQSSKSQWVMELTQKIFKMYPESRVVLVDWEGPAAQKYPFAVYSTDSVGKHVANLLDKLILKHSIPLSNIVLIGYSLGAHICGFTGKYFTASTNSKLPRIIALDPTGILFALRPNSRKLNSNDAEVVHVIHTDGGKIGLTAPCGTIDFYPNAGTNQPGCPYTDVFRTAESVNCDHERAYQYFIESIENLGSFYAQECLSAEELKNKSCTGENVAMGDLETTLRGIFYLETNSKPPFSKSTIYDVLIEKVFGGEGKIDIRNGEPGYQNNTSV